MELYGYHFIRESEVLHGDPKFGIPELKKYPMPDAKHVQSAIKFFNYVSPKYEKQLARAILARMKEYGMSFDDFGVGEENRFSKYIPKDELMHYGLKGMKWGTRHWQNYDATNTFNAAGIQRYFGRTPGKDSQAVKEPKVYHKPSVASKKAGSSKIENPEKHDVTRIMKQQQQYDKKDENERIRTAAIDQVKKIVSSKEFKVAMGVTVAVAVTYVGYKVGIKHIRQIAQMKNTKLGEMCYKTGLDRLDDLPKNFDKIDDIPKTYRLSAARYFNHSEHLTPEQQYSSAKRLVNMVNEDGFGRLDVARNNNCTFCTSSIVMRLKGYDVHAAETLFGFHDSNCTDFFSGAKFSYFKPFTSESKVIKTIKSAGNGHYGDVHVRWKGGGGHSMAYAIRNGKLEILDGQTAEVYLEGSESFKKLMSCIIVDETSFADLTTCEPTSMILKTVKNSNYVPKQFSVEDYAKTLGLEHLLKF